MADYLFPNIIPSQAGFNIISPSELEISELSGVEYITNANYERWFVDLRFSVLKRSEAMQLRGHLMKLMGGRHRSLITDLGFVNTGPLNGTIRINGANEYGTQVSLDGMPANSTQANAGDRIKIGKRVHELTDTLTTNASGQAIAHLGNEVIDIPADNEVVEVDPANLSIACRWVDPTEMRQFSGNKSYYRNISLSFIEAFAP